MLQQQKIMKEINIMKISLEEEKRQINTESKDKIRELIMLGTTFHNKPYQKVGDLIMNHKEDQSVTIWDPWMWNAIIAMPCTLNQKSSQLQHEQIRNLEAVVYKARYGFLLLESLQGHSKRCCVASAHILNHSKKTSGNTMLHLHLHLWALKWILLLQMHQVHIAFA